MPFRVFDYFSYQRHKAPLFFRKDDTVSNATKLAGPVLIHLILMRHVFNGLRLLSPFSALGWLIPDLCSSTAIPSEMSKNRLAISIVRNIVNLTTAIAEPRSVIAANGNVLKTEFDLVIWAEHRKSIG